MNLRGPAVAAITLCLALATGPAARAEPTTTHETVAIPCAGTDMAVPVDWRLPVGTPRGLIWLQHGFARSNVNIAGLATAFADAGYLVFTPSLPFLDFAGCTLQNLTGNTEFLGAIANLFASAQNPGSALARSFAAAAAHAGRPELRLPGRYAFVGHSAGGEAVEYVAHRLRTDHPGSSSGLQGLVLLDPVKSFVGDNTDRALTDLDSTSLPILTVSGPPSLCNAFGSGTNAVQSLLHRSYVGIRISTGVHTDAEGTSVDTLGSLLCGTPESVNITTLRTLALGWLGDYFTGTRSADYYPPDAPLTDAQTARTAVARVAAAPDAQILSGAS
ncbi:alpha/beta hydrolase [Nocardia sp. NPDC006044]|uniref:alpha/beta hydrolase n=1 Tax=Nocardia sp. NPDC006044 TaxID=3364306 RepID=UPI0036A65B72